MTADEGQIDVEKLIAENIRKREDELGRHLTPDEARQERKLALPLSAMKAGGEPPGRGDTDEG